MRRCSRRSPRALPGRRATCGGAPPRRPRNSRYRNYPHWTRKVGDAGLYIEQGEQLLKRVGPCAGLLHSVQLYSVYLYICTSVHLYICICVQLYSVQARMSTFIVPSSVCVSLSPSACLVAQVRPRKHRPPRRRRRLRRRRPRRRHPPRR